MDLRVESGPPLAVNSDAEVANLRAADATNAGFANDADKLDGRDSTGFLARNTSNSANSTNGFYQKSSNLTSGTLNAGTGERTDLISCDSGGRATGGGVFQVDPGTQILDSSTSATLADWSVRWKDDGVGSLDQIRIQVLCVDLTP